MRRVSVSKYWIFQIAGWGAFALVNTCFAYSFEKLNDTQDVLLFFGRLGIFVALGLAGTGPVAGTLDRTAERELLPRILGIVHRSRSRNLLQKRDCRPPHLLYEGIRGFTSF